jgi:plastocyanin
MSKSLLFLLGLVALSFSFPIPGAGDEVPDQGGDSKVVRISIVESARDKCDEAFDPDVVTVPAGTTVEWVNNDQATHTMVSAKGTDPCNMQPAPPAERVIDTELFPTRTFKMVFDKPGTYLYACHLPMHHMEGKIIVVPK